MDALSNKILTEVLDYLLLNVAILGLIGNFLSYKVFSSSPSLHKHPISIFFRAIPIFDSIMLLNSFSYVLVHKFSFSFTKLGDIFCKFKNYFFYAAGPISPWLMVFVSIDRFISIRYPKRFPFLYKRSFRIGLVFLVVLYNYLFYSFMTWNSALVSDNSTGTVIIYCRYSYDSNTLQWMDFFNSTIVPFICMTILSVALIYYVRKARSNVYRHKQQQSPNGNSSQPPSASRRDNRFAVSVITLNIMFLVLNLPIVIDDVIVSSSTPAMKVLDFFSLLLYYVFYSIGFYTQFVVNTEFKKEFWKLLNLRSIGNSNTDGGSTKSNGVELTHSVTNYNY